MRKSLCLWGREGSSVAAVHAHHSTGHADLLELDAHVQRSVLEELTGWAAALAPREVRTVVDLGAGTGSGSVALAGRFPSASVVAVDRSAEMLARTTAAAHVGGLDGRVRPLQADLDAAWPEVGPADVLWASSSLHELADPDRVLRDAAATLTPGGLLVAVEIDSLPRFLPTGPGADLEDRCVAVLTRLGWNAFPDWTPHLERAGLVVAGSRSFPLEDTVPVDLARRYAEVWLTRVRSAVADHLPAGDLAALDRLLAADGPEALAHRRDLTVRTRRTAWAALRP